MAEFPWEEFAPTNTATASPPWEDFAVKPKKTREQVVAEVNAAQAARGPEEGLGVMGNIGNALYWPTQIASRMFPTTAIRDAMQGVATGISGAPPEYFQEVFDRPLLSAEAAKSAVEFISPGGPASSEVGQGVQNFLAHMASGLTTTEGVAGLASGKISPTLPAISFGGPMVQGIPQSVEQVAQTQGAQQVEAALGLLSNVVFPLMMAKGALKAQEPKPSGIRPVDFRDMEAEAAQERGYGIKEGVQPSRQVPVVLGQQPPPRQMFYGPFGQDIVQPNVPMKAPVEPSGGEISFRAPAQAEAIPSAGQTRVPPVLLRDVPEQQRLMEGQFVPAGKLLEERAAALRAQQLRKSVEEQPAPLQRIKEVVEQPGMVGDLYNRQWERFKEWAQTTKDRYAIEGALAEWQNAPFDNRRQEANTLLNNRLTEILKEKEQEGQTMEPAPLPGPVSGSMGSVKKVLGDISKDKTSPLNQISQQLLKLGDQTGLELPIYRKSEPGALGTYHPSWFGEPEHITIAPYLSGHEAHKTIVHEALHGFVWMKTDPSIRQSYKQPNHRQVLENYLQNGSDVATKELIQTYLEAKQKLPAEAQVKYGMRDYAEFLSEAWSNADFQRYLQQTKSIFGGSLWDKMVKAVKRMLGLNVEDSLLADVLRVSSGVVSRERPANAEMIAGEPQFVSSEFKPKETDASKIRSAQEEVPQTGNVGGNVREARSDDTQQPGRQRTGTEGIRGQEAQGKGQVGGMVIAGKEPIRVPIQIKDAQGNLREGEFTGYYDLSELGRGFVPSVGWKTESGKMTHGMLPKGEEIVGKVPSVEEWQKVQAEKPEGLSLKEPIPTLYHGTTKAFEGTPSSSRKPDARLKNEAIFTSLSTSSKMAEEFTGQHILTKQEGGRIIPVKINVNRVWDFRNPKHKQLLIDNANKIVEAENADVRNWKGGDILDIETFKNEVKNGDYRSVEIAAKFIKDQGFDAFTNREQGSDVVNYHVFDPSKIRSAIGGSIPSEAKGMQTRLKPGQGGEKGSIVNPLTAIVEKFKGKEKEKRDIFSLRGPQIAIDPKESGFKDPTKVVDAQQLWNRIKNKLTPAERDIYERAGVDKKIVAKGKVSPEEAGRMLQEVDLQTKVVSYGMEGKVSEAKREYDKLVHEMDTSPYNWRDFEPGEKPPVNWPKEFVEKWNKANELEHKARQEEFSSPRATSAYEQVSAFPTSEKMPEWTTSKEGKNVQRVDVVIPLKKGSEMVGPTGKRKAFSENPLWQPDNLHENLPNTLGWAMVQYKTGPKGEKIAFVSEAQSRWGQTLREQQKQISERAQAGMKTAGERDIAHPLLRDYNRLILKAAIDQARKEGATHIVVSDAETAMMTEGHDIVGPAMIEASPNNQRLAQEVIENKNEPNSIWSNLNSYNRQRVQRLSEGSTQHFDEIKPYLGDIGFNVTRVISQEPGMRLNYDTILPKIAEELTGSKGEKVSLGEHKNALVETQRRANQEQFGDTAQEFNQFAVLRGENPYSRYREDLIFRNSDGTPKTDVSGVMYPLPKTEKSFSLFEKDRPEQVEDRLYLNPIGPIVKQTAKDVGTLAKKGKEVVSDAIKAYAEPLQEQIGKIGGPVAKKVSEEAGQILSRAKELYGSVTPVLDPAKKQVSKMYREGTTWMRSLNKVTDKAAFNNFFGNNEGVVTAPLNARRGLRLASDANVEIAKMIPGFVPTGKLQRILTSHGYDFVVRGGEGRENFIEGVAALNNKPVGDVRAFVEMWGKKLGDKSTDAATLDKISQDFIRRYPRTVTHVRTATGWHEVVVSDPFNYLEQAAQRTAHAVAFREVYPRGSGMLDATRKAIQTELKDKSDIVKFDNLIRALQGHPLDTFKGEASTAMSSLASPLSSMTKALMLSANVVPNLSETVVGGPSIFLGYRNLVPAATKLITDNTFAGQLELSGARNRAMYNYAFDPSSPVRSTSRQASNVIRTGTGQQWLNEVQETIAAASAKVYSDRIQAGGMNTYESNRAIAVFRAMGFTREQANQMIAGDAALLKQFENRAAAWLTGGNKAMAEMSRLGASRAFNAAFWFHNYPQTRLNQMRSVLGNLIDDVKAGDRKQAYHNSVLVGRQLGGVALQGAIALGIIAAFQGGKSGVEEQKQEAKDAPFLFARDAMLAGYGGPLAVLNKMAQNTKSGDSLVKELTSLSPPANIASEFVDMGLGIGKYQGQDKFEKISTFIEGKTPVIRGAKLGLAIAGLSEKDVELEVAIKSFYKWRRSQPGYAPASYLGGTEEQLDLRGQMKKVKQALQDGGDWVAELKKVGDNKAAAASLRAGTLLELNGKPLSEEQLKALRSRIGSKLVDRLQTRDAMVREVARGLAERTEEGVKKTPEQLPKPTGKYAVDFETDTKRSERVTQALSPKVREFLQKAEVTSLDYTPSLPEGRGKRQLTVEEAKTMEKHFVEALEELIGSADIRTENMVVRRNVAQRMVEGARKIAMAKTLGEVK